MYLNAHSFFSLRYGTLSPTQLVAAAAERQVPVLALTDINNTSAALEFVRACEAQGIKPVLGIEYRDATGRFLYTGIARNNAGWAALCQLLTDYSLNNKPLPAVPPPMEDVFIIYDHEVKPLPMFRPYEFIGIRPAAANRFFSSPLRKALDRLVVWQPVTFLDQEGYRLHKFLRAIDANTLVTKLEEVPIAGPDESFPSELDVMVPFRIYPKIIENTRALLQACSISFQTGLHRNRQNFTGSKDGDMQLLTKLALNGSERRYGPRNARAQERIRKELKMIAEMDFATYFLITWDIIRYATGSGYHHVGRGSGANSIVAYCLGITDVEPLELELYFERFINPQRSSPPDFDIDFSWDERDDVTDYIFKRYGQKHTALLATYSTFQHAAVVRELGKTLGLAPADIDAILDTPDAPGLHRWAPHILQYGKLLTNFPNYLSIHAGGVLISEQPLHEATALQMMPKGFPIVHFDMYAAEEWGYQKFDVLSQRGLGHIKTCVDLVRENQGRAVDVHQVEKLKMDEGVRAQLRSGRCIGCFYIESPAMRGLLHKLRCDNYIHLVAASSIIRPGVARSGMMREYIQRFHQPNGFEYLHETFQTHLHETFGVMVYQEDVMKILHYFAGLGLDEADVMRRMMTGKKRSSTAFARLQQKYFDNCRGRGYPEQITQEVWRQIESFAGYSFCKAHSASFAVESFQSLYLKTYYPLEFMVAVINNFGGFYSTEFYVHEARMSGGVIEAPCINHSLHLTRLQGNTVWLGLIHVHGLEQQLVRDIVEERETGGIFQSLEDFARRVTVAAKQLDILIRIGAFRFTNIKKSALLWDKNRVLTPEAGLGTNLIFGPENALQLPELEEGIFDQAFDEIELLGFPLCSPFSLLDGGWEPGSMGIAATEMAEKVNQTVTMTGYYVCRKDTRTIKGELMHFGTWLDEKGQFFDTVHFPSQLKKTAFRGKGIYRLRGRLVSDFGFITLETAEMERLPWKTDERYV